MLIMDRRTIYEKEKIIALLNVDTSTYELLTLCNLGNLGFMHFSNGIDLNEHQKKNKLNIQAVISQSEVAAPLGIHLLKSLREEKFPDIPFFLVSSCLNENLIRIAIENGITDVFKTPLRKDHVEKRVDFSMKRWSTLKQCRSISTMPVYKISLLKRIFDILISGSALLILSPLFLVVVCLLKLESKGAVFYYSLRVGSGYKVFKFYKFRSMYTNADKRIKDLKHLNQYSSKKTETSKEDTSTLCAECTNAGSACRNQLFADDNVWCEKKYLYSKKAQGESAFFKLRDDPRITRVGKVLRNTSIDELPQMWNVLRGDMSIVGNRPLPLYEAEKLTTDKYAHRFLAPAGITGLWQVEKRGKGEMSEEERLMLDNKYATNNNFRKDISILLKTLPALFQKESV